MLCSQPRRLSRDYTVVKELATQLINYHASIFLGVILLGMNKPGPWKCPRTSSKKRTKTENKRLKSAESLSCDYGIKPEKIEWRAEKGAAKIAHILSGWLVSSYPIRHAFSQHISEKVSVECVLNKGKSSWHFAWRNCSMFVHLTNTAMILDLKGFLINSKLFLSTSEYYYCY